MGCPMHVVFGYLRHEASSHLSSLTRAFFFYSHTEIWSCSLIYSSSSSPHAQKNINKNAFIIKEAVSEAGSPYPWEVILQDISTWHGTEFVCKDVCIVNSLGNQR